MDSRGSLAPPRLPPPTRTQRADVLTVKAGPQELGPLGRKGKWGTETHICESFEFERSSVYWAQRVEEGLGSWFPLSLVA